MLVGKNKQKSHVKNSIRKKLVFITKIWSKEKIIHLSIKKISLIFYENQPIFCWILNSWLFVYTAIAVYRNAKLTFIPRLQYTAIAGFPWLNFDWFWLFDWLFMVWSIFSTYHFHGVQLSSIDNQIQLCLIDIPWNISCEYIDA